MSKIGKTLLGIVLVIIALVILQIIRFSIDDRHTKQSLQSRFQRVELPASLQLKSQTYQPGSVDNGSRWTYEYAVTSDRATIYPQLKSALQTAGFQITQDSPYLDSLQAKEEDVLISVSLEPGANGGTPGPLEQVLVTVSK